MNTFGRLFRFTSYGESHGKGIGVIVDGCPAGLELNLEEIQYELDRRKPGQSKIASPRREPDALSCQSGCFEGKTTGAPLGFWVENRDHRPSDYTQMSHAFRPSHADYTYFVKYGHRDPRGGGRSSARETIARVIAGSVAKQLLRKVADIRIEAWVQSIGTVSMPTPPDKLNFLTDECQWVQCPDPESARQMVAAIQEVQKRGDTLGGVISCRCFQVPPGWGEPIYGKLEADLAGAMLGINAAKGFEVGSGFEGTRQLGSQQNDAFFYDGNQVRTRTNRSGGIQGGISNGMPIEFRVAFKPVSTLFQDQETVSMDFQKTTLHAKGRHDPCVVPRAVPIVEAMAAVVLANAFLEWRAFLKF